MLRFFDHILYRRAHFIRDVRCASRATLTIKYLYAKSFILVIGFKKSNIFIFPIVKKAAKYF